MIKALRLEEADFSGLKKSWDSLLERSRQKDNFFLSYDWMSEWWSVYGKGNELFLIAFEDAGRLIGIAPLYLEAKAVRIMGDGEVCSDHLGLIFDKEYEEAGFAQFADYLNKNANAWDVLKLEGISAEQTNLFDRYLSQNKFRLLCADTL